MFANRVTGIVVVKDDDGLDVKVTIRKISRRVLAQASELRQLKAAKLSSTLGPEMLKDLQNNASSLNQKKPDPETTEEKLKAKKDKKFATAYATYDVDTVLHSGITGWNIKTDLSAGIDDLDEKTSDILFKAIIDISIEDEDEVTAAPKD